MRKMKEIGELKLGGWFETGAKDNSRHQARKQSQGESCVRVQPELASPQCCTQAASPLPLIPRAIEPSL